MRSPLCLSMFTLAATVSCGGPEPAISPAQSAASAAPSAPASSASWSARADGGAIIDVPTAAASASSAAVSAVVSFADDLAFLTKHGPVHVLEAANGARVAVSPKYQARVMTSAVEAEGASFGWINRDAITSGKVGTQFDNYGGEDRFWLGPEGGQFGLYFPPGKPFTFDAWQVPAALQEGAWDVTEATPTRAAFRRTMALTNWSGASFSLTVDRTISITAPPSVDGVRAVAFETVNKITNTGKAAWKRQSGLLSIWILAMYAPASDTRVIVPFETEGPAKGTPIVNDAYFGKIAPERLSVREDRGFLLFTCDGKERGKIGVGPARAKSVLGSYSAKNKLLTVVHYEPLKPKAPYVNSMWEQQKSPYAGDVVNSYNDGSPGPGKPPLGGFYEIETSSPGAELAPSGSLSHTHRTFHFVGEPSVLEPIAKKMLGVSLDDLAAP